MRANTLNFWNGTTENLCINAYVGQNLTLVNATSQCYKEVQQDEIQEDGAYRHSCTEATSIIQGINYWKSTECMHRNNITRDLFKYVNKDGYIHIYCFPAKITIGNDIVPCPKGPFKLPDEQTLEVGNKHFYMAERRTVSLVNDGITQSKINFKLRTNYQPIVIEGYERSTRILDSLPGLINITGIKWIEDIPRYPGLRAVSDVDFSLSSTLKFAYYFFIIIIILAVWSCLSPFIFIFLTIARFALRPVKEIVVHSANLMPEWMHPAYNQTLPTHVPSEKKYRLLLLRERLLALS